MIKLLIVDDSALMRRQLTQLFQAAGGFEVRQARNGVEAVTENREFQPDVVTLDINMPEMDGITALSLIMAERPVPVIMVSSLTEKGALATFEALNLGAVDYVAKPGGTISLSLDVVKADLLAKVRAAAKSRPAKYRSLGLGSSRPTRTSPDLQPVKTLPSRSGPASDGLLLIGVSTGGPRALEQVLPLLPADFPWPVLVAQHMPASFTAPFAARLNGSCELEVVEAASPMPVQAGRVYIGKGGADMVLTRRANVLTVLPKPEDSQQLWHPSVELLGRSALQHCAPRHLVGVMLTGMGYDGAEAFSDIKRLGGRTIAEAESTAVVFGMPAELIARGGASLVLPLDKIAAQVKAWAQR
ncbi:chemotaxis-specific protein-glutamate methyltransferase CheB [Curvibacter sp. HBC61]|uniref:Protein-glutamate methylesterase/protein-glutamine glutaminase n=1 Tax=Curvibacter cyanobacteriorum TaxID=3026422 RepID=A0ABT5N0E9_9BURK|nr:chemotaxis-specific protein-glutamate methyltransferase CheB [Curvibacter sp. HBC61]MDD0839790.1 chemotaxis-specific protein-glutamate methyltransferase CheB [Curvibacter sp. HBC61]